MTDEFTLIDTILSLVNSEKYFSNIRIEQDNPIMIKTVRGGWVDADVIQSPTIEDIRIFFNSLDPSWEENIVKGSINKPLDLSKWRLRINAYLAFGGKKLMASIRRIPLNAPTITETGLPASTRLLLESTSGLILISGPTGAGKTTSMAAMIDVINETRNAHILTIEDPIEFVYKSKKSVFSQREIGVDCQSFAEGVKDSLRQQPDVIVIGEIRDKETAEQALIAGESGHLVIGTLHASSATGTITKLLGFFNSDERASRLQSLQGSLVGIINQTLIPKNKGEGYALAVDFIANHKRQYSKILGEPDKVQSMLDRSEDPLSIGLGASIAKLIAEKVVDKGDAAQSVSGNAAVYEKIRAI